MVFCFDMKLRRIRQEAAHESLPRSGKNIVHAPTSEQYTAMLDRLVHGEEAFRDTYPELALDFDFDEYVIRHPEVPGLLNYYLAPGEEPERISTNIVRELLAGPKQSVRDFVELSSRTELWHERDIKWLQMVTISGNGCWEMPKYVDHIIPDRARYPQPVTYSSEHGDIRKQMGAAWMWDRVIGPLPLDKLPDGKRAFWPDHRCNNKACVYPRHTVLGKPEANDAFTARMETMRTYKDWTSRQWARPSFAYPDGLESIVHESEVLVLSDRAVILPVHMSKKELIECESILIGAPHLPDGGWTTDLGIHVLFGAIKRGLDFDEETGCWNARFNLDQLSPHKQTITHECGNNRCCNIRHMDITKDHKQYYSLQEESFVTEPDGRIINTNTGEYLPPYWQSWMLYWDWLKKYSGSPSAQQERELESENSPQELLTEIDFEHIWVHPLTGCWENQRFYPRWTASGAQQNAYGFHRSFGEFGRSTHRYLLYKFYEAVGDKLEPDLAFDADHKCNNRRCCNPLHLEFEVKSEHRILTANRIKYGTYRVKVARTLIARNTRLRNLGR